jgi:hypothetical protein
MKAGPERDRIVYEAKLKERNEAAAAAAAAAVAKSEERTGGWVFLVCKLLLLAQTELPA